MMHTLLYIGRTYHGNSSTNFQETHPVWFFLALLLPLVLAFSLAYFFSKRLKNDLSGGSYRIESYLLILVSKIIKADGVVTNKELRKVELYIDKNHNKRRAKRHRVNFTKFLHTEYDLKSVASKMNYHKTFRSPGGGVRKSSAHKIKWLHFLIGIAVCDKLMSANEYDLLNEIRRYLNLHDNTFQSILALHNYISEEELNKQKAVKQYALNNIDREYKILGLSSNASVDDIKVAYRKMVKLYHPDKQIGKKLNKNTKFRFQQVQDAYEAIKKHRII